MAYYPARGLATRRPRGSPGTEENYARDGFGLWILHDRSGAFVGDCGLTWQIVDGIEDLKMGYHLLPQFQGCGLATEAATAGRELARSAASPTPACRDHSPGESAVPTRRRKIGLSAETDTLNGAGLPIRVYAGRLERAEPALRVAPLHLIGAEPALRDEAVLEQAECGASRSGPAIRTGRCRRTAPGRRSRRG